MSAQAGISKVVRFKKHWLSISNRKPNYKPVYLLSMSIGAHLWIRGLVKFIRITDIPGAHRGRSPGLPAFKARFQTRLFSVNQRPIAFNLIQ